METDLAQDYGFGSNTEAVAVRKRDRSVFGADCEEEEETTTKKPFLNQNQVIDNEDHLVMSGEQWDHHKKYVKDLVATTMGYKTTAPFGVDYMHITTSGGRTLFASMESDDVDSDPDLYDLKRAKFQGDLLGMPIATIKAIVEAEEREERLKKAESTGAEEIAVSTVGTKLWVDKYSPKSFTDLLSDEYMNRKVLIWLKEWSGIVFGKPFANPLPNRFPPRGAPGAPAPTAPSEPKDRPDQHCLLISGPPGIGKTTLAHIIAKTAGFEPVEFNASDDRTASTFMPKVLDVIATESRFGSGKPKALIIDEIDGVAGGEGKSAVDALAKLLDEKKNKRPIICICNEVWAPSLRPLRDRSLQIRLDPPSVQSLVSRLEYVCTTEGVSVDNQILQILCELTNRDIRSCLNTLQFLSRKAHHITPELFATTSFGNKDMTTNIFDVWKSVFMKEEERSTALQALLDSAQRFHQLKQLSKSGSKSGTDLAASSSLSSRNGTTSSSAVKPKSNLERIHTMVKGNNSDKILDGVYENVLLVKYHDPLLKNTVTIANWFEFYDELSTQIMAKQLFQLSTYIPYVAGATHLLCSTTTSHQSIYPRQAGIAYATRSVNAATIQQFQSGILAPLRPFLDVSRIVLDVASFLIRILAPRLRPVNIALLTPDEKARLTSLVAIHLAYGLNYVESSNPQLDYPEDEEKLALWRKRFDALRGQVNSLQMPRFDMTSHLFVLNPPIHRVTHFSPNPGKKAPDTSGKHRHSTLPDFDATSDTIRQVVSMQLHAEKLRRLGSKGGLEVILTENIDPQPSNGKGRHVKAAKKESAAPEVEVVHVDFFGRRIEPKIKPAAVEETKPAAIQLYYKYHEGKTDAVRRKVLIRDLL